MRLGLTPARRNAAFAILALAWASVAVLRITATYTVFSNTYDEPNHLVAGMEWLQRGTFRFEPKHPPLGRIAIALAPYLDGVRLQGQPDLRGAGSEILYSRGTYLRDLTLARLGILPFFLSATLCVWLWGRRLYGDGGAALAVVLFTTTPLVLGHAGVATTDMPLTGTLIWALVAFSAWLDDKSVTNGVLVGAAAAAAVLSKMSAVMFLPAGASALMIVRWLFHRRDSDAPFVRPSRRAELSLVAAATTALFFVWALYRFSVGRRMHSFIPGGVPLLAPEFFDGFVALAIHNAHGHPSFLLGEYGTTGWWYFFPVALALKTPIPMLVLTAVGIAAAVRAACWRAAWRLAAPGIAALAILAVSMRARINIGVRHVLPIIPLLAIAAAYGTVWLWNQNHGRRAARATVVGLLGWQLVSSARANPDYLPYFNEFAGQHPGRLLLDSDLDWGQDLIRLADTLRVRRIDSVSVAYFGTADVAQALGAHARRLRPNEHATGWVAASAQYLLHPNPDLDGYKWINAYEPVAQVGKSIRLFFVPPPAR